MQDKTSICFGTATCRRDVHYARCLLGSIRYFYPENPIVVVCDRDVSDVDRRQLASFPNVTVYSTAQLTDRYKLAFRGTLTDLYYLVLQDHNHYVFCDADSVLTGPVLDLLEGDPAFASFTGKQMDLSSPSSREGFCKYAINLDAADGLDLGFLSDKPFYFQSSHFYVDRLRFPIEELYEHLPRLDFGVGKTIDTPFQRGDQGFFCYVLNKHLVETDQFLHVPCTPSALPEEIQQRGITLEAVKAKTADPGFLHFVGPTRRWTLGRHAGGNLLRFFAGRFQEDSDGTPLRSDAGRLLRTFPSAAKKFLAKGGAS